MHHLPHTHSTHTALFSNTDEPTSNSRATEWKPATRARHRSPPHTRAQHTHRLARCSNNHTQASYHTTTATMSPAAALMARSSSSSAVTAAAAAAAAGASAPLPLRRAQRVAVCGAQRRAACRIIAAAAGPSSSSSSCCAPPPLAARRPPPQQRRRRAGAAVAVRASSEQDQQQQQQQQQQDQQREVVYNKEFGYSRKDVLIIIVGLIALGVLLYEGLQAAGMDAGMAGNWVQLIIFLGICVGWVSTYLWRVANKKMTYARQLEMYESAVMQKRLEEMTEAELQRLMAEVESDRARVQAAKQELESRRQA